MKVYWKVLNKYIITSCKTGSKLITDEAQSYIVVQRVFTKVFIPPPVISFAFEISSNKWAKINFLK